MNSIKEQFTAKKVNSTADRDKFVQENQIPTQMMNDKEGGVGIEGWRK